MMRSLPTELVYSLSVEFGVLNGEIARLVIGMSDDPIAAARAIKNHSEFVREMLALLIARCDEIIDSQH